MKIVETIIVSNFPMNIVIHAFLETETLEEIKMYYEKKQKSSVNALSFFISQM